MAGRRRRYRDRVVYPLAVGLLRAGSRASLTTLRRVGQTIAALVWSLAWRDRRRARVHLQASFPDQSRGRIRDTQRELARHLGSLLGEMIWLWSATPQAILERTSIVGLEHLTNALDAGQGTVLVTGHCGNWEWLNLALGAAGVPMTVAAREVFDPRLDQLARVLRGRFGADTVLRGDRAGQKLVQALRRGRVAGLVIDQDIQAPGVFVEFFGRPAWTPSGAALLAVRLQVPVVTAFCTRERDGGMELVVSPPRPPVHTNAAETAAAQLTAELTAAIEQQIRSTPAQWVWFHRRWRRQPGPGERIWRATPHPPQSPAPS